MINSKEYLPKIKRHITRPKLEALYKKGLNSPLTTVTAGTGFGKTTSCVSFVNNVNAYVIWIDLSDLHNDVNYFWTYMKKVITSCFETTDPSPENLNFPESQNDYYKLLLSDQSQKYKSNRLVIVYDNYEILTNKEIIRFISRCINIGLHTDGFDLHHIILSNEHLDKYKNPFYDDYNTPGEYNRITVFDLMFSEDEIAKYLALYDLSSVDFNLAELQKKSGGWPVFISILCETRSINKTYLILFELFENHLFGNFSDTMQMALIRTALFPSFPLGLLNEILADYDDSIMQALVSNIFIIYDFDEELFSFQSVYYSFIKDKLVLISDEEKLKYYNIAGNWYYKEKDFEKASQYYMLAKDYQGFLDAISYTSLNKNSMENSMDMQHFFKDTPTPIKKENPWVDFYLTCTYVNCNQVNIAKNRFEELLTIEETKHNSNKHLMAEIYRLLGEISILKNTLEGVSLIDKAIDLIKEKAPAFHQEVNTVDENPVFYLPESGDKNVEEMISYINEFCQKRELVSRSSNFGFEQLFAAEAYYYKGNMKSAKVAANLAISKSLLLKQYDISMQSHYILALIAIYEKDYESMTEQIEKLHEYATDENDIELIQLHDVLYATLLLEIDDESKIATWIKNNGFEVYDEQPFKKGRNYLVGALYALHTGDFSRTITMLFQLEELFEQRKLWVLRFYFYLIKSIYYYHENQKDLSIQNFVQAYHMIYENNLFVLIIEFGIQVLPILTLARSTKKYNIDMEWLRELEQKTRAYEENRRYIRTAYKQNKNKFTGHRFTLTKKEKNVLNLLSQGYTRNEIAAHLEISVNGVKKFINNIYTKLGAKNRAEAIFIAAQGKLL